MLKKNNCFFMEFSKIFARTIALLILDLFKMADVPIPLVAEEITEFISNGLTFIIALSILYERYKKGDIHWFGKKK